MSKRMAKKLHQVPTFRDGPEIGEAVAPGFRSKRPDDHIPDTSRAVCSIQPVTTLPSGEDVNKAAGMDPAPQHLRGAGYTRMVRRGIMKWCMSGSHDTLG